MSADIQSDRSRNLPHGAEPTAPKAEPAWGAIIVIVGLFAIVVIFVVAVVTFKQASDVATATSGVSGVIAALVGAYFGVRGATLAHKQAGEQQESRERRMEGK